MNNKYRYIGCFFDKNELAQAVSSIKRSPLAKKIEYPHITFEYMPTSVDESLFGKRIDVIIKGYGNNGENEGVLVDVFSDEKVLAEKIKMIEVPHITLSIANDAKAVNTRFLIFNEIEPIRISGLFGGFSGQAITKNKV